MALRLRRLFVWFLAAYVGSGVLTAPQVAAHSYDKGDIRVRHPWTRASAAGEKSAGAYMEIRNSSKEPDRLIGASSTVAERIVLHAKRDDDSSRTREAETLPIRAQRRLLLSPSGSHLELAGLRRPLLKGDRIPLILRFERAGELRVELEVQAADTKRAQH